MTTRPGETLLHFSVVEKLGAGGMGEVFRALDTRLGREVAIKILPTDLRRDPERLARLEREARLLASLNHPHLATLHGLEETEEGTRLLVMELVEGETLAERLRSGPLSVEEICLYGAQIAEALSAAHAQGIVHRDLKPGNVMLSGSGVKLLDFGLARSAAPSIAEADQESTLSAADNEPLTREGTLIGTLAYMAPEQLEGQPASAGSDMWSLGVVLHEMATGQRAFDARSSASLIAAILEHEPALVSEGRDDVPPALAHLVASCLVKDPLRRRQSARDLAADLHWLRTGGQQQRSPLSQSGRRGRRARQVVSWIGVAVLGLIAVLGWIGRLETVPAHGSTRETRFDVSVPWLAWNATETALSISPHGDALLYASAPGPELTSVLWLRELDEPEARPLEGTEGALNPFWSPDGRHYGYVQDGTIRVVPRAGGPSRALIEVAQVHGPPSWGADDTILLSTVTGDGDLGQSPPSPTLIRLPASGGEPEVLDLASADASAYWYPHWLSESRFLATRVGSPVEGPAQLFVVDLESLETTLVGSVHSRAEFGGGHLVYWSEGMVIARSFDPEQAQFTGEPIIVGRASGGHVARTAMSAFTSARDGSVLVFGSRPVATELRWFDRSGKSLDRLEVPSTPVDLRIAPSGDRVLLQIYDHRLGESGLWLLDLTRRVATPVPTGPGSTSNPVWSPDGARIAYTNDGRTHPQIFLRQADGRGEPRYLCCERGMVAYVHDWSRLDDSIAFVNWRETQDLWTVSTGEPAAPTQYAAGSGHQSEARFSPDGRWIAFSSSAIGPMEVWAAPRDDGAARTKVSLAGGYCPVWSVGGDELYYASGDTLWVVAFSPATEAFGAARPLFSLPEPLEIASFDVEPNGERFLLIVDDREASRSKFTVVLGWSGGP